MPELGSQVLTFVAIFLPLSSLWAAASINHKADPSSGRCGVRGGGGAGGAGSGFGGGGGGGGGGKSRGIGIFGIFTRSSDDHHTTDTPTNTTTNNAAAINASDTGKRKAGRAKRGHLRFMGIGQSNVSSRAGTANNTGNDASTGTGIISSSTGSDGSDGSDGGVGIGIEGIEKEKEKY